MRHILREEPYGSLLKMVLGLSRVAGRMMKPGEVVGILTSSAASTCADSVKGEALVLFTTALDLTREQLFAAAKAAGSPEFSVPRDLRRVEAIPLLGSGKTDYVALKRMAEASAASGHSS